MENAVEALQIAFGVLFFVVALTLSISCFSQATTAVNSIISLRDTHTEYKAVNPSNGLNRIVGAETIVPTMYSAYSNNIEIYFKIKNADGTTSPMPIYYQTDEYGRKIIDENTSLPVTVDYIDSEKEIYEDSDIEIKHLDMILEVGTSNYSNSNIKDKYGQDMLERFKNQLYYPNGFYNYIIDNNKKFEERLGEYYQGSDSATSTSSTQAKKRVITYTLINP